jgi:GntR family transcriptional repressor for pyruvate dehydrogenase complex
MVMSSIAPAARQRLADDVAQRIRQLIQLRGFAAGDRIPSISDLAGAFRVGAPTVREALRKLEAVGAVEIRHGSGVYVGPHLADSLLISNPVFDGGFSKKLLVDLIEARVPIELQSTALAASNATPEQLEEMRRLLDQAERNLEDDALLNQTNLAFHKQIAVASGNSVLRQLLDVLSSLFREEQRMILGIHGSRRQDHVEHCAIYEALAARDADLAQTRMRLHLEGVRDVLVRWDPQVHPVT